MYVNMRACVLEAAHVFLQGRNDFLCYCQRTIVSGPSVELGTITATDSDYTTLLTF